ncbi:hypothetical protein L6452_43837 [Arctium lappa]|uniref:Uncharacterized protein n=1 Tax=Arctium lappa TaxID=4217 RepID=A0ACB8XFV6_ARCLA|nr:hypothetical protein L6452_43837 [Arctium lappa]
MSKGVARGVLFCSIGGSYNGFGERLRGFKLAARGRVSGCGLENVGISIRFALTVTSSIEVGYSGSRCSDVQNGSVVSALDNSSGLILARVDYVAGLIVGDVCGLRAVIMGARDVGCGSGPGTFKGSALDAYFSCYCWCLSLANNVMVDVFGP